VDLVSSVMRRYQILDELGQPRSTELEHKGLLDYLRDTVNVGDYDNVAKSFDPALKVEALTLRQEATLLRLYGGESKAIGRFFFCCLWFPPTTDFADLVAIGKAELGFYWSDASGLATPPDNLGDHLAIAKIPAGTPVIIGTVADNFTDRFGRPAKGGNTQIFIPHVSTFPYQKYRLRPFSGAVSEIEVLSDDQVLWFRQ
jgi:hypothetical protein